MNNSLNKYSKSIDGLRSIAIISVIINHMNKDILPSGFLGVDVFFVISGFVITASLFNRKVTNSKDYFLGFYKRRIKRLYPALLFCFAISAFLISFVDPIPKSSIITGLLSVPGFSNIYLYFNSVDYWSETASLNPFTHTWSLGVEEQFYLIFPLVLFFTTKLLWNKPSLNRSFIITTILCFASFIGYFSFFDSKPELTYFMMPFRFWEIGLGCITFMFLSKLKSIPKISFWSINFLLILITLIFFVQQPYYAYSTTGISILTALLIFCIKSVEEHNENINYNILTTKPFIYVGKISYSLYLWHWVVIVLFRWTYGINIMNAAIIIVLMFMFSIISYEFIEKPLRFKSWRKEFQPKVILAPFTFIWILFFALQLTAVPVDWLYLGKKKVTETKVSSFSIESIEENPKFSKIRVIGNSHSLHIMPILLKIRNNTDVEVIAEKDPDYINIPSGSNKDIKKLASVLEPLEKNDILIISGRHRFLYENPYRNGPGNKWVEHFDLKKKQGFGLKIWLEELDQAIKEAKTKGINIVFFLPNVEFDKEVPPTKLCETKDFSKADEYCFPTVSREYLNARFSKEFYDAIEERVKLHDNFSAFDPLPTYCPEGQDPCPRIVNGILAFKDTNHLTEDGAMLLFEPFVKFLQSSNLW